MSNKTLPKIVLTHRSIDALCASPVAYRVPDVRCPGLAIRVAPSGRKTWDFVARLRGTSIVKRKALGAFPAIGLDDARQRATAIGRAAQAGRDLLGEEAKLAQEAKDRITVEQLIDDYLKRRAKNLRTKHEIAIRLKRVLAPIRSRPAENVQRRDIAKLLNATADRGVEREAERRRQTMSAMFKWAVAEDLINDDPTRGLKAFSPGKLRDRILLLDEICSLWTWLAQSNLTLDMSDSLRLQLCIGCRIGEASGMRAEEFDTTNWIWTLPVARSKNKKRRLTPIVGLARAIAEGETADDLQACGFERATRRRRKCA